jgi:GT2 family glycosyltransferase
LSETSLGPEPVYSVLIATHNRASELDRCLATLASMERVAGLEHEVIVLDNNSRDNTRNVAEGAAPAFGGRLRYAFVGRQGKAHALNHGIAIARGELLGFTDDDARVDPGWLRAVDRGRRSFPDAVGFGGRVIAEWSVPVPPWLAVDGPYRLIKSGVTGHDLGAAPRVYKESDPMMPLPAGVNLWVRRDAFARYGGFRADLWPGEDTELGLRLWQAGEKLVYLPDLVVTHPVDPTRLSKRYFRQWSYDKARSMVRMETEPDGPDARGMRAGATVAGIPPYLLRMALDEAGQWIRSLSDPVRRFHHECRLWGIWGRIAETRRLGMGASRGR